MTPYEQLIKANDDYHEAVGEIFLSEDISVEVKAKFGAFHNNIFQLMTEAQTLFESEPEGGE